MRVLLFAGLAESLGTRSVEVEHAATVGELVQQLHERWPQLAQLSYRVAVDQRYASEADSLAGGEELALIPPVSGG
jgi:molybdopterin converting factor subunit 1